MIYRAASGCNTLRLQLPFPRQEATSHIVGTASKYTPMELVLVSEALRSLQCGHTELLYRVKERIFVFFQLVQRLSYCLHELQIMERKDDILQPHST